MLDGVIEAPGPGPRAGGGGRRPGGLSAWGGLVGGGVVIVDETRRGRSRGRADGKVFSLPPLGVGIAIYLPSTVILPVVIGAVAGWVYDRLMKNRPEGQIAKGLGVLMVSGLIVGEGLFNVVLALLIVVTGKPTPLSVVGDSFEKTGVMLAGLGYAVIGLGLYFWTWRKSRTV